ncbi:GFA family protein [Halomonas urumqiensis]|uniref:Aldehyde-activating protein n=2 Tax=Halomonas urumqiensis TaxID=1684789 RepID=A0A2N7UHR2_9GAMM|nr:GFA family protein [Halomonas urumqiensis]PMR79953.1 aldehyde-activating protein [Halomonas urumqiensis]PTB02022.1 GFA family protein [Halomonas urumqiensis]
MKGSCLCGAIEYEVSTLDMPITFCHCQRCRKAHAAPFAPTAGVMRENFRWLKGEDTLSSFESSPGKARYFCSVCGSQLVAERAGQPHIILRVATLDEDPGARPEAHIWVSHDVEWLVHEDIPVHKEWQVDG